MRRFILLLMQLFTLNLALASIHHVPENYSSIQSALNSCDEGDTVLVAPGIYNELLIIPPVSLSLMSTYIYTGDTLDISNTVIDGQYAGTVVTINQDRDYFTLKGFTVKGGYGYWRNTRLEMGGGFHIRACDSLNFDHLILEEMRSNCNGALASISMFDGESQDIVMRNILIRNIDIVEHPGYTDKIIWANLSGDLILENIEIDGSQQGWPGIRFYSFEGKGYLKNIHAHNFQNAYGSLIIVSTEDSVFVEDMIVENNHFHYLTNNRSQMQTVGIGSGSHGTYKRLFFRNNTSVGECDEDEDAGCSLSGQTIQADSIFFINNHSNYGRTCGIMYGAGLIENLFILGNTIGDEQFEGNPEVSCSRGPHLELYDCSVRNLIFSNNSLTVYPNPAQGDEPALGGTCRGGIHYFGSRDGIVMKMTNGEFSNNFVDDRDVYAILPGEQPYFPNLGRALYIKPSEGSIVTLDSCLFVNNRQPNHVPEYPWQAFGHRCIGSTIEIHAGIDSDETPASVTLKNCEIRDNDDGGIFSTGIIHTTFENLKVVDTDRMGIRIEAPLCRAILRNVLIDGTVQRDNWYGIPDAEDWVYQSALTMLGESIVAENVTIANCDVPYVMVLKHDWYIEAPVVVQNLLIWNNRYDLWTHPVVEPEDYAHFHYSLLQEEQLGTNNIIGQNPLFHPDFGVPYLASDSPCIDSGNPDDSYNDIAGLLNPNFALWPSQGSLRNDIGYTGGPNLSITDLVDLDEGNKPKTLPTALNLHNAYPNPFNPTTTIEFDLSSAASVKIQVYNLGGQRIRTLLNEAKPAGTHHVLFQAHHLASGIYLIQVQAGSSIDNKKVLLLK